MKDIVSQLKSTTCTLDTMPAKNLFIYSFILNCIAPNILQMILPVRPVSTSLKNCRNANYGRCQTSCFGGERLFFNKLVYLWCVTTTTTTSDPTTSLMHFSLDPDLNIKLTCVLIKVLNDIHRKNYASKASILVLLDLCALFDTIDHNGLFDRLEK